METITMTSREQRRAKVLARVAEGRLTVELAAAELGLSVRQVWRLLAAVRAAGPAGLVHGNRGRPSARRTDAAVRTVILGLLRGRYRDVNDSHVVELLAQEHGIAIGRETLRGLRRAEGLASPRRRRAPRHRARRERMPAAGMLLQLDGSRHRWLEERGPWLTLLGAVDDATGELLAATFRDQEDAAGYFEVLRAVVSARGLPDAVYRDRHGVFEPTLAVRGSDPDEPEVRLSQVGRALVELDIVSIPAGSPQAKGRIERLWGTLQDRLVVALRFAGAADRATANAVLGEFVPGFNARFRVPAAEPAARWRPVPAGLDLERVFAFKYRRRVARDGTIAVMGRTLQLSGRRGTTLAGHRVEVHVRLDGSVLAFDGDRIIALAPAPASATQLRAGRYRRVEPSLTPAPATLPWTPPGDHPWNRLGTFRSRSTD
jgi:transposase